MEEFEDRFGSGEVVPIIPNTTARMTKAKGPVADQMPDCVIVIHNILQALAQDGNEAGDDAVCGQCGLIGSACALCGASMDLCCLSMEDWAEWEDNANLEEHFGPFDARELPKEVATRVAPDNLCVLCHLWLTHWADADGAPGQ